MLGSGLLCWSASRETLIRVERLDGFYKQSERGREKKKAKAGVEAERRTFSGQF
jgi:hypothetical protein